MAAGEVIHAGSWGSGGRTVRVRHSNGYVSYYMHLEHMSVSVGQSVEAGQQIGGAGDSGGDFAVHLHFEIRNQSGTAINPLEFWHRDDRRYPGTNPNPVFVLQNNVFVFNQNYNW